VTFNSLTFLVFFAVVLLFARLPLAWRTRKAGLLVASYLFYAAWNPPFVALLLLSTLVDWLAAGAIARSERPAPRRLLLGLSLLTNLGLLGFFKYGELLIESTQALLASVGIAWAPPPLGIVLPVGLSFYTFQSMSYTIDVYRGRLRPWPSPLDFALYVSFFPQLVAGPIVRGDQFLPQCRSARRAGAAELGWGLTLLVIGLFEKAILADVLLAPVTDMVFANAARAGAAVAWLGALAFSGQVFFDFAGYSTCAIGVAACLGFRLPRNFAFPYAATSPREFWRRWHISLSTWLRDYVYVPLGGSRAGRARTLASLMITMLLGGLWHGASWRFAVWGALHGLYLVGDHLLTERRRARGRRPLSARAQPALMLVTFALFNLSWPLFRAPSFGDAFLLTSAMVSPLATGDLMVGDARAAIVLTIVAALLAGHWWLRERSLEEAAAWLPWWVRSLALALLLVTLALLPGDDRAFIYFQF